MSSVQPRIRLTRSFDERSHTYLGYVLRVNGLMDGQAEEFLVAIGRAAQEKHRFRIGDRIQGASESVADARLESASYYKTSGLKLTQRQAEPADDSPPYSGVAPALESTEARHRRLQPAVYGSPVCHVSGAVGCRWRSSLTIGTLTDVNTV